MRSLTIAGLAACALLIGGGRMAVAQPEVSSADIQRLQESLFQADSDVAALRARDPERAARLQTELDELREDVIYLRVKLRREGRLGRTEYAEVRDRIADVRTRARGDAAAEPRREPEQRAPADTDQQATRGRPADPGTIPVGAELDVRLQHSLSSRTAQVEDRFEATTVVDLMQDNQVLVPAGSIMRGIVTSVDRATRADRRGSLTVVFDQLAIDGRNYPLRATVTRAIESEGIRGEAGRIGTGAGVGAVIGGIIGGVRGALLGVLIGAGGTIAATEGQDVNLPSGTILRVRIDSPVKVR